MQKSNNNNIGQRLRQLRHERNMTQAQVAEKINMSKDVYGRIERGASMSVEVLQCLKRLYAVSAADILCEDMESRKSVDNSSNTGMKHLIHEIILLAEKYDTTYINMVSGLSVKYDMSMVMKHFDAETDNTKKIQSYIQNAMKEMGRLSFAAGLTFWCRLSNISW